MITSKQRSKLKGLANRMNTIFQVGKSGLSDQLVAQVSDALRAREPVSYTQRLPQLPKAAESQ